MYRYLLNTVLPIAGHHQKLSVRQHECITADSRSASFRGLTRIEIAQVPSTNPEIISVHSWEINKHKRTECHRDFTHKCTFHSCMFLSSDVVFRNCMACHRRQLDQSTGSLPRILSQTGRKSHWRHQDRVHCRVFPDRHH